MVSFVRHDLDFILNGIKISEQHATREDANGNPIAGTPLTDLIDNPLSAIGMRTVTGEYNNLIDGQQNFGATDNVFPRMLTQNFRDAENLTADPDHNPATGQNVGDATSYTQTSGWVEDSSVRTISNLISDQSATNPAAVDSSDGTLDADGMSFLIPNTAPDEGLSAPFNSWMTLFGQFFDHGLDLVGKGGNGTVFIPLQPDDPLYQAGSPTNFMVLTRATVAEHDPGPDGQMNTADDIRGHNNSTSPFVDQNQTYTSHPSHQVFLREYEMTPDGPMATGGLIKGAAGALATWADVKAQARDLLGIDLTDANVENVPLLATDEYGRFLRGPNGLPQVVMDDGAGGTTLVEGNLAAPISLDGAIPSGQAFIVDIAHNAVPVFDQNGALVADADADTGNAVQVDPMTGRNLEYDNELLDRHYMAGDGRINENIGLTAVHHVFHAEHNRLVEHTKDVILETGDLDFINEWLDVPVGSVPMTPTEIAALDWNGERLFQAAKFGTEMQYQHLVFEEFGRKVAPLIDVFSGLPEPDIDPAIVAEFAHTVYRFGHSMLTETVDRMAADGQTTEQIDLITAFLNPVMYDNDGTISHEEAAGAIVRGMTRQTGNEIDEFVTGALRNNLLGLPLDLAAINLARGRDTGVPSLNEARRQFYEQTNDTHLKPYDDWLEFAQNMKNPVSLVNFIAAYGTHPSVTAETTIEGKRDAATLLVFGNTDLDDSGTIEPNEVAPADRLDYLRGEGAWDGVETGLNNVDFWIGGLAEAIQPFGGMLGSTFNFVFETQMEALQAGDRFYYLWRTQGLNFLNELEGNSLAGMIMRTTDLGELDATHLPADIFASMTHILEVDQSKQLEADPTWDDPLLEATMGPLVERGVDPVSGANILQYKGGDHVVLGGSEDADILIGGIGDDAIWGDGGNDIIEGGHGADALAGGDGDDIITDIGGDDNLQGGAGNDVISSGNGFDLVISGSGDDFVIMGEDASEVFMGLGNDFARGESDFDTFFGGEGDDWMEGGAGTDLLLGDNGNFFEGIDRSLEVAGHDVLIGGAGADDYAGEGGDDIMFQDSDVAESAGEFGFDWATHQDQMADTHSDLLFRVPPANVGHDDTLEDRFELVEAASGWHGNDHLLGDHRDGVVPLDDNGNPVFDLEATFDGHQLTGDGVARIAGLNAVLEGAVEYNPAATGQETAFENGNILIGGDGSDIFEGRGGHDVIDGDAYLRVQIEWVNPADGSTERGDRMEHFASRMLDGTINPGDLRIVREILYDADPSDNVDTAVYSGNSADYTITAADGTGARQVIDNRVDVPETDGVDLVRNIERLQFADQTIVISGGNAPPTGTAAISDLTPTEKQELSAFLVEDDDGVIDPNGVAPGTVAYQWQVETEPGVWMNISGAVGMTFTPGDAEANQSIRVVISYVDGLGIPEQITSGATAPVVAINDAPTDMTGTFEVDENAANATVVGAPTVVDPDSTAFTFALVNDAGGAFAIDPTTGTVTVADRMLIDFEQAQTLDIRISANDGDTTIERDFTVTVVDEAPEMVTGDARDNTIRAGDGNDVLDGLGGLDTLGAGLGDDRYFVDNLGDVVEEAVGEGNDTVTASSDWTLAAGVEVETLVAADGAGVALTGNEFDNALVSGSGNDMLAGGLGDDTYEVNNASDQVIELAGQGNDTVTASASWTLGAGSEVETLVAADGTGIALGGNELDNTLVSGTGSDNLAGGLGNDRLYVNDATDTVTEAVGEGRDVVLASTDWTLNAGSEVEVIRADGAGLSLTGNEFNNALISGMGNDALAGGLGNDRFYVNGAADTVTEAIGEGRDIVLASADWALGAGSEVEVIRANSSAGLSLMGNELNNVLMSGAGSDDLAGGLGNDRYYVNDAADTVAEAAGEGHDVVLATADWTLGAGSEVEVVRSNSAAGISLAGNELNNMIKSGAGSDALAGGLGNDVYFVNDATDTVTEAAGEGHDVVLSSSDWALAAGSEVEVVRATGAAGVSLSGNELNNGLIGSAGDDVLEGGDGNDWLEGRLGNDTFVFASGPQRDVVIDFDTDAAGGQDLLDISALGVTAASFGTDVLIQDSAAGAWVTIGDTKIVLRNVAANTVDETDFLLSV